MISRYEVGSIAGIPIFLDMMFVLVLFFFTYPYFTMGDSQAMSAGIVVVIGLLLSILLHELGHAFAGRMFSARVTHIELTGIGGVAHFERSLPPSVIPRVIIFLAGPAVNLALWYAFDAGSQWAFLQSKPMLATALFSLAASNYYLLLFNLLPAYPLDGGNTADAILGKIFGAITATRVVASLGIAIAAYLAVTALPGANFIPGELGNLEQRGRLGPQALVHHT
jgi:Zn-dependent protease